ncbi:MAG: hypothetical protein JWM57_622 [Phycisphaerales bacterium]|nr:hypothetical protein [Phycisphaerales bacterium]
MRSETNSKTGKKVPDTATTYERAKPEQESPSKSLEAPTTTKGKQQDELAKNARPSSPKNEK